MSRNEDETTLPSDSIVQIRATRLTMLTVSAHSDLDRIGERVVLPVGPHRVSRTGPLFAAARDGAEGRPLDDRRVSRKPLEITARGDGSVVLTAESSGPSVRVGRDRLLGSVELTADEVEAGVSIELGSRVALVLHKQLYDDLAPRVERHGMVGQSGAMVRLDRQIDRLAIMSVPALVYGASGTGKELVARALHAYSERAEGPFVSVNIGAIPAPTAAAALFGHAKGAFTGAETASSGYFGAAEGGSLFLDEIGTAPLDIQAALLRALESGEIQPVGSPKPRQANVRLVTATDEDLDAAVEAGTFRLALLQRLRGAEIRMEPLRRRRDDIMVLMRHFLEIELDAIDRRGRLEQAAEGGKPWLPGWVAAAAVRHDWPGNVRELRNVARQLVVDWSEVNEIPLDPAVERLFRAPGHKSSAPPPPVPQHVTGKPKEPEVLAALERHGWRIDPAARALGMSRSSLYALIQRSETLPKASALDATSIAAVVTSCAGDLGKAASHFRVTERALKLRMKELGLSAD